MKLERFRARRIWLAAVGLAAVGCLFTAEAQRGVSAEPISEPASPEQPKIKEVGEALAKFQQRDFDGALAVLKDAAKKYPDELPPAEVVMAEFFLRANVPAGFRRYLEKAIRDVPDDPQAFVILGNLNLRQGAYTEAGMLYAKAADLLANFKGSAKRKDTLQPIVLGGLAAVAEFREDWPEAQKQLEAWQKLDPKNATALQRLARARFQQLDAAGALELLRKAKEADSDVLTPEAQLALFYQAYGDQPKAKKWMEIALQAAPKDLQTHLVAGRWALETGDLDRAKSEASAAMNIDPKSSDAKILRGMVALFTGDYPAAETYFEDVVILSPSNLVAKNNLALALCEQNDATKTRRALEYALGMVRENQNNQEVASTYGWVLYKAGRGNEAAQVLGNIQRTGAFSADTAYYIARVLADRNAQNDKEAATRLLKAALQSNRPFRKQRDAQALLKELEASAPAPSKSE